MAFLDDYPNLSLDNIASALKGDKNWSDVIDSSPQSQDGNQLPPDAVPATTSSTNSSVPDTALLDSDILQKLSDTVANSMPTKSDDQQETVPEESEESDEEEEEPKEVTSAAKEAVTSAPIADNVINFGNTENSNADTLKRLLKQKEDVTLANQLGKAAELIGSGVASAGSHGFVAPTQRTGTELFNQNIALAGQPIQDFMTLTAQQRQDPNSPYAQGLRDFMKDTLHLNIKGGTPEQIMSVAPLAVKAYDAQQAIQARKDVAKENANAREAVAHENALNRLATIQARGDISSDKQSAAQEQKDKQLLSKDIPQITNFTRDRPAQSAGETIRLINNALLPFDNLKPGQNISKDTWGRIQSEAAKVLQGGAATEASYGHVVSPTLFNKFDYFKNMIDPGTQISNPSQALELKHYLEQVKNESSNLLANKINGNLTAYALIHTPEQINTLRNAAYEKVGINPTQTSEPTSQLVTVRRKSDGVTKTLDSQAASKYLSDPAYEAVK